VSATAASLAALGTAGFALLLWAIGGAVTAAGSRMAAAESPSRQYLAGRLDAVRIAAIVAGEDELLVSLATPAAAPLTGVFCIRASTSALPRVQRWGAEGTPLRAYLSRDGAIMLTDPALGGHAACEPPATSTWPARDADLRP
jgi:hypothetical protein